MNSVSAAERLKSFGDAGPVCNKSIIFPSRVVTLANSFEKKDRSWYSNFL
jgi:hypothetical protein